MFTTVYDIRSDDLARSQRAARQYLHLQAAAERRAQSRRTLAGPAWLRRPRAPWARRLRPRRGEGLA